MQTSSVEYLFNNQNSVQFTFVSFSKIPFFFFLIDHSGFIFHSGVENAIANCSIAHNEYNRCEKIDVTLLNFVCFCFLWSNSVDEFANIVLLAAMLQLIAESTLKA